MPRLGTLSLELRVPGLGLKILMVMCGLGALRFFNAAPWFPIALLGVSWLATIYCAGDSHTQARAGSPGGPRLTKAHMDPPL